ncbi:MAG TPA: hypothetical protein PKC65_15965 [Pyrinomonadaceae bacterium]|nr:hypothetical protein [Pyrinomonadaceae bacterium]
MTYRYLTADEKGLIERILAYQPRGEVPEVIFATDARAEEICSDGTLKFRTTKSSKQWYYPVEARFIDDDGISVSAIVFAIEEEVSMLEILKADGSIPIRKPSPDKWEIIDLSANHIGT